jgi:hypothetical protein
MKDGRGRRTRAQKAEFDLWARKQLAVKNLNSECYDLFLEIVTFLGGAVEIECSKERNGLHHFISTMPKYNGAAQDRIRRNTL